MLTSLLAGAHGAAAVVVLVMGWPPAAASALLVLIAASLLHALRVHVLRRAARSVREARWDPQGRWYVLAGDGTDHDARLLPGSVVTHRLAVLNYALAGGGRATLILLPDSVPRDILRRLAMRVRMSAAAASTGTGSAG